MRPQEIIAVKRDGGELAAGQIEAFVDGVCEGSWADYQISAMLMAMFTRGLSREEQDALTYAMLHSGEVLDLSWIDKPKVDKHSTGGVGDKTSLIIAPVLAACGAAVPMISGRGLGHTGGTLDKLESIPGFRVDLTRSDLISIIEKCGYAMSGQTDDFAPADRKLYALRDATATVPYIPLIVASIMSKKLAEGLDALILDVKTGDGAFMQSLDDSVSLARALEVTGNGFGLEAKAVVSDMSQPLGKYVGNALEVIECIEIMRGNTPEGAESTVELSVELSARLLLLSGISDHFEKAKSLVMESIASGDALERFRSNIVLQGGDLAVCDRPASLLERDLVEQPIVAPRSGFVCSADALAIGGSVVEIGGGRTKADDAIDHAVGFALKARIGDEVREGDTLGLLYCRTSDQAESVRQKLESAFRIEDEPTERPALIRAII